MHKRIKKIMTACVVFSLILSLAGCRQEPEIRLTKDSVQIDETSGSEKHPASENIYVYICGAVKKPGVYELAADSRIYQLVEQAGGLSKKADRTGVNLAEPLQDGQMIRIPEKAKSGKTDVSETPEDVSDGRVNINTAAREQLMTLTGIGQSKAERILEYREKNGSFQKIEDIMKVDGIKEGTFEKIKNSISVQ